MDRITDILKSQVPQQSYPDGDPMGDFIAALAQKQSMDGVSQGQSPDLAGVTNAAAQTRQMAAQGHPQAAAALKVADIHFGNDEQAKDGFINFVHDLPTPVDSTNSYQMNTLAAQYSKQSGFNDSYKQMPSDLELQVQDLANVASGKGTDFLGIKQKAQKNIADIASQEALVGQRVSGGTAPAAIQIANAIGEAQTELEAAINSGDLTAAKAAQQKLNNLQQSAKIVKLGEGMQMQGDQVTELNGYGDTAGGIKENIEYHGAKGAKEGASKGENVAAFNDFIAGIPALETSTKRLYTLADLATYTNAGRVRDIAKRQLGMNVGSPAAARAEYENIVRVEVLPTLKATFGAQFTVKEGEWLLETLGDKNLSPAEKKAALDARIQGWKNLANTYARRADKEVPQGIFEGIGKGAGGKVIDYSEYFQ